jgi:hypothetical protein
MVSQTGMHTNIGMPAIFYWYAALGKKNWTLTPSKNFKTYIQSKTHTHTHIYIYIRGVSKTFGEWYQKTNITEIQTN